jgi:hypothetical protein
VTKFCIDENHAHIALRPFYRACGRFFGRVRHGQLGQCHFIAVGPAARLGGAFAFDDQSRPLNRVALFGEFNATGFAHDRHAYLAGVL